MIRLWKRRGRVIAIAGILMAVFLFGGIAAPTSVEAATKSTVRKSWNGVYTLNGTRFYLKKGVTNKKFTGLAQDSRTGKYYFFRNGKGDSSFTGVARNPKNKRWYFVRKGVYDNSFTGICRSSANKSWYYVKNGKLDWGFTGVAKSIANGKLYYVKNGKLDWNYSGTVSSGGAIYTVTKGSAVRKEAARSSVKTAVINKSEISEIANWAGKKLTRTLGVVTGPSGKETYYNLDMTEVVNRMRRRGNTDPYWVRSDGVKMLGDYVMVAANLSLRPRGSYVMSSLGMAIVVDTGGFASRNPTQLDIAVNW